MQQLLRIQEKSRLIGLVRKMQAKSHASDYVVADFQSMGELIKANGEHLGRMEEALKAGGLFWQPDRFGSLMVKGDETVLRQVSARASAGLAEIRNRWPEKKHEISKKLGPVVASCLRDTDSALSKITFTVRDGVFEARLEAPPMRVMTLFWTYFLLSKSRRKLPSVQVRAQRSARSAEYDVLPDGVKVEPPGETLDRTSRVVRPEGPPEDRVEKRRTFTRSKARPK